MNFLTRVSTRAMPFTLRQSFKHLTTNRVCGLVTVCQNPVGKLYPQPPIFAFSKAKQAHQTVNRQTDRGSGYMMQQLLTGCLSVYSYYIESEGEAVIIDPINEIDKYVEILKERKTKLKYIFLTHFHADFVAGHLQLQNKFKGCEIVMGPKTQTDAFKVRIAKDGEEYKVGSVSIKVIHTPGHTEESSCYLLLNSDHRAQSLFTGDTLFLGEVGRPDLAAKSDFSSKDLAFMLFDSLEKIKKLPSHTKIYPGHGAGSPCGKNISKGDVCNLETQLKSNYALQFHTKEEFAREVLHGMPNPPQYFFNVIAKNKHQPFPFQEAFKKANKALSVAEFKEQLQKPNTHIIDVRGSNEEFNKGVIKGSYYIGHYGPFANYVGHLLSPSHNYLIIGDPSVVEDTIKRLIRIGYLNVKGYNKFPMSDWNQKDIIKYRHATLHDLKKAQRHENDYTILDIRNKNEWENGVFQGNLVKVPLIELEKQINEGSLPRDKEYMVHCASGYRAKISANILAKYQYKFLVLTDPFNTYVQNGATVVKNERQSTQSTQPTPTQQN